MSEEAFPNRHYQKCMHTAVRLLARRDHSRFEIIKKLRQRSFDRAAINAVLAECERLNYIDDARTARVYVGQLARRGFGFHRMRSELKKKGLQDHCVVAMRDEIGSEIDELEIAKNALQKKIKHFEREENREKRRVKIYRFLYARGFTDMVISQLLRELHSYF